MNLRKKILFVYSISLFVSSILFAQPQTNVVEIAVSPKKLKIEKNSSFKIAVDVAIQPGYHINSDKPNDEYLIPTSVVLQNKSFSLVKRVYPKPREVKIAGEDTPVLVFRDKIRIELELKTEKNVKTGIASLPVMLNFQACNDRGCLPPNSVQKSIDIEVLAGTSEPSQEKSIPEINKSAQALHDTLRVIKREPVSASASGSGSFLLSIFFAFLGGIILNLMPCVLPVLSLKIMGFVRQAGEDKKKSRIHGFLFALGVLVSFWTLAGILLILRAGGEELGWGFQLQSPVFLVVLSIFIFLFALSLFGVFEIGTSFTRVQSTQSGYLGSFTSGVTATLIATPCTAPFMGSALGYALTQPAYSSMIIFTSLGLGMASPYVLLASNPKWLRFIPKPGAWMETFKQAMGFLLLATTGWLIWVLSNQVETEKIIILLFALLGVSVAGWIWGKWGTIIQKPGTRILALLVAAALLVGSSYKTISSVLESHKENIPAWQQYSPELVEQLRRENKAVFIDFTAKWCLSCQVNKKVALHTEEVEKMFRKKGVVTLEADWTNRDEAVTKALAAFHRNSVPLYVLFPSGENKQPIILPEVLTPGIVISSLEKLDGK